jgi:hypothetical protein
MENEVLPLEQIDTEVAQFFQDIAQGKKPYGIKTLYIKENGAAIIDKGRGFELWRDPIVPLVSKKIDRNDSCPFCKENGIEIKWKKCKEHNNG